MLAYVYGVVPISLCRGGGCGVSRGKGRGVRIDFDEDNGPITGEDAEYFLCLKRSKAAGYRSPDLIVNNLLRGALQWRMRGEPSSPRASARAVWTGRSAV